MGILRADRITGLGGANAIKGSVHFHGGGDCGGLETEVSSDFQFGSNDFTIEVWANWSAFDSSGFATIVKSGNTNGSNSMFQFDYKSSESKLRIIPYVSNSSVVKQVSFTPEFDRWYHLAAVRDGNNLKIFVDGTQTGGDLAFSDTIDTETTGLSIGKRAMSDENNGYERNFNGYLSNLRIVNGTAIYTADFTPPTNELEKTSDTVLLALQSPGNLFQEATGKKLYVAADRLNQQSVTPSRKTPNSPVGFSTTTDVGRQYGSTFDGFCNFATSTYMVPPGGNTRERNRGRGFYGIGFATPTQSDNIDYLNIQSLGNTITFGSLTIAKYAIGSGASSTRGIFHGGYLPSSSPDTDINSIEFVTIASTGNATDFGDRTVVGRNPAAASSSTRVVMASGQVGNPGIINTMDFVTTATTGNATDFGDLLSATNDMCNACNSPTRGVFSGGNQASSPHNQNVIQYITMASAGNATDFGDLTLKARSAAGGTASSNTRGLILICNSSPNNNLNNIEFITIASTGNATDFGDLFTGRYGAASCSNLNRAVFLGGRTPSYINTMDTVLIASTGNASDFGDITGATGGTGAGAANSDSHGGLS